MELFARLNTNTDDECETVILRRPVTFHSLIAAIAIQLNDEVSFISSLRRRPKNQGILAYIRNDQHAEQLKPGELVVCYLK